MARLIAIAICALFQSSRCLQASQGSPWRMKIQWDRDGNGVSVQGQLQTKIPEVPSLMQVTGNESATNNSVPPQPSGERSSDEGLPGQSAETISSDATDSRGTADVGSSNDGGGAGEPEISELRAQRPEQYEHSLEGIQSGAMNPKGAVVEVRLNSELQEGDGKVQPVDFVSLPAKLESDKAAATRNAGCDGNSSSSNAAFIGLQPALAQFADSSSEDWPLESVWNSAGDHITPAPAPGARSEGGAGTHKHAGNAKAGASELRAGKRDNKWSLGRKESDLDNPDGAVMKVTLNSELQESGVATEPHP